jgi:hypothetical protein
MPDATVDNELEGVDSGQQQSNESPHPLRTVEGRLATFGGWSKHNCTEGVGSESTAESSLALSPLALARAGFYRIDDPEHFRTVRCAYCRMEMANLKAEHPAPSIMYVQLRHADDFLSWVAELVCFLVLCMEFLSRRHLCFNERMTVVSAVGTRGGPRSARWCWKRSKKQ